MTFSASLIFVYRELAIFVRRLWWIVLFLVIPDLIAIALAALPGSEGWAVWRSDAVVYSWYFLALLLQLPVIYVLVRFLALQGDGESAISFNTASLRTFAPFALFWLASRFALSFGREATEWGVWWLVLDLLLMMLLALWTVSAPSGRNVISPLASARAVAPRLIWSTGFLIVALLPLALFGWVKSAAGRMDWAEAEWAEPIFYGLDTVYLAADTLIFFAAIYAIARHAGLEVKPR
jgi:hypothetical protein